MAYATDLTQLLTNYGFNNNIRVGSSYNSAAAADYVLESTILKFVRSISSGYTPLYCKKNVSGSALTEQVTWDAVNNMMKIYKRAHRVNASTDWNHEAYARMKISVENNYPVGLRLGMRYV